MTHTTQNATGTSKAITIQQCVTTRGRHLVTCSTLTKSISSLKENQIPGMTLRLVLHFKLDEKDLYIAAENVLLVMMLHCFPRVPLRGKYHKRFTTWTAIVPTLDPHMLILQTVLLEELHDVPNICLVRQTLQSYNPPLLLNWGRGVAITRHLIMYNRLRGRRGICPVLSLWCPLLSWQGVLLMSWWGVPVFPVAKMRMMLSIVWVPGGHALFSRIIPRVRVTHFFKHLSP